MWFLEYSLASLLRCLRTFCCIKGGGKMWVAVEARMYQACVLAWYIPVVLATSSWIFSASFPARLQPVRPELFVHVSHSSSSDYSKDQPSFSPPQCSLSYSLQQTPSHFFLYVSITCSLFLLPEQTHPWQCPGLVPRKPLLLVQRDVGGKLNMFACWTDLKQMTLRYS